VNGDDHVVVGMDEDDLRAARLGLRSHIDAMVLWCCGVEVRFSPRPLCVPPLQPTPQTGPAFASLVSGRPGAGA
jgi:hypothetical protein